MVDEETKARKEALDARLAKLKGEDPAPHHMEEHYSQAQHAWRMVIELVAGLIVGFGIGYGLDIVLGTQPFLMVVFTLLGFAAGVLGMVRSAREMQEKTPADAAGTDERDGTRGGRG